MHDIERDSRVCDRIKAVLLASEGWTQTMISQALRIHESTVARRLSDYVLSEKLKPENGGSQSKLSDTQTTHLIEHLTEKPILILIKLSPTLKRHLDLIILSLV